MIRGCSDCRQETSHHQTRTINRIHACRMSQHCQSQRMRQINRRHTTIFAHSSIGAVPQARHPRSNAIQTASQLTAYNNAHAALLLDILTPNDMIFIRKYCYSPFHVKFKQGTVSNAELLRNRQDGYLHLTPKFVHTLVPCLNFSLINICC